MAKNRFAISTVFDIDERPFNQGIRNTTGTVNVFARKTTKRFGQMAHDIKNSMASFNNPFAGSFAMGGALGLGAVFSGINSQNVLQAKYQAEAIGLTASELAALTPIAKKVGLESEHLTGIFEEMHNKVGLAKKGIFEGGLKDYGISIGMDSKELNAFLKKDTMGQFEEIIDELNKLDLQTAIGLADGLFSGESNRLYRSLRVNFNGDLEAAKAYWATLNNLSDEGRKGNEEYAMALNDLTASLSTAFDDMTGKFGHALTPAIGYVTNGFNEIYRNSDYYLDLLGESISSHFAGRFSSGLSFGFSYITDEFRELYQNNNHYLDLLGESISEHLDLSMDDVSKWSTGVIALLGAAGTAWAAKKGAGKITAKVKQTLGLNKELQKVFVTNWPIGFGGGGGYDPGLENPYSNDKGGKTGKGGSFGKVLKSNLVNLTTAGWMLSQAEDYGSPINIRRKSEVEMPDWAGDMPVSAGLLDVYDDIREWLKNASPEIFDGKSSNQNQLKKDSENLEKMTTALQALVINADKPMSSNQTLLNSDTAIKAYQTNAFGR